MKANPKSINEIRNTNLLKLPGYETISDKEFYRSLRTFESKYGKAMQQLADLDSKK